MCIRDRKETATESEAAAALGIPTNAISTNQITLYEQGKALSNQWRMIGGEIMRATLELMAENAPYFASADTLSRAMEIAASENPAGLAEYKQKVSGNTTEKKRPFSARD